MPKRPWSSYHTVQGKPYVQRWKKTKRGRREYVHGVPDPKIRIFSMGTNKDYEYKIILIADEPMQISHLALEAARIASNRYLRKNVGRENYFLRILVYPHHVVREHRMMAFAGADRLQDGMRLSFGKPFGTAARVRCNQHLISVKVNKNHLEFAEDALRRARMKFPLSSHTEIVELKKGVIND